MPIFTIIVIGKAPYKWTRKRTYLNGDRKFIKNIQYTHTHTHTT